MEEAYETAIGHLNSRKAPAKAKMDDMRGSDDMVECSFWRQVEDLKQLNAVHIAGTNGKGSTCAFISSFLKAHGELTGKSRKIGLYTSPHMTNIRERIRINGEPISKEHFTTRFFEFWNKLPTEPTRQLDIPREPVVTAISSFTLDHVQTLGPGIQNIAWHKAGIIKSGSIAISTHQEEEVAVVLLRRAAEKSVFLEFVGKDPSPQIDMIKLATQQLNCSLALAVVRAWLEIKGYDINCDKHDFITPGIKQFFWPGRYQTIDEQRCRRYLDGAHNEAGLRFAVDWFADAIKNDQQSAAAPQCMLIFAHYSARDGVALLRSITESLRNMELQMEYIMVTSYDERRNGPPRTERNFNKRFSLEKQEQYVKSWKIVDPIATVVPARTIEDAIAHAREIGGMYGSIQVLVTGSIHLVSWNASSRIGHT